MSIRAVRTERDHHIGTDASEVAGNGRDRMMRLRAVDMLVRVVEHGDVADTELGGGLPQLGFANGAKRQRAGMLLMAWRKGQIPAAAAARRGQQRHRAAFRRVLRQRATHAKRLVVGMGEDSQKSQRAHRQPLILRARALARSTLVVLRRIGKANWSVEHGEATGFAVRYRHLVVSGFSRT